MAIYFIKRPRALLNTKLRPVPSREKTTKEVVKVLIVNHHKRKIGVVGINTKESLKREFFKFFFLTRMLVAYVPVNMI